MCQWAHFSPVGLALLRWWTYSLPGWQGCSHVHALVCFPQTLLALATGLDMYRFSSFLIIWIVDWDGSVSPPYTCRNHKPPLPQGTTSLALPFPSSHIFSRLHSFRLYVCKGGSTSIAPGCTTLLFACLNTGLCGSSGNKRRGFVNSGVFSPGVSVLSASEKPSP